MCGVREKLARVRSFSVFVHYLCIHAAYTPLYTTFFQHTLSATLTSTRKLHTAALNFGFSGLLVYTCSLHLHIYIFYTLQKHTHIHYMYSNTYQHTEAQHTAALDFSGGAHTRTRAHNGLADHCAVMHL